MDVDKVSSAHASMGCRLCQLFICHGGHLVEGFALEELYCAQGWCGVS